MTKDDYLIILGDWGVVWKNRPDRQEEYLRKWYENKNCTTLFIDGNHENHPRLEALERVEMFGGTVGKYSDSIFHLRRGEVYTIAGKKFFCFGGAASVDKENRTEWISWWKEEVPNYKEQNYGLENLEKHGNKVDYILSHTCPQGIKSLVLGYEGERFGDWLGRKFYDPTTQYLEEVCNKVEYEGLHFGHFHQDKSWGKFHCHYNGVTRLI